MASSARLHGLPPIIGAQARVLILGSFPSAASLAAQQYYAHPQNQFWRILGAVLGQPLKEMDYSARIAAMQAAGIALWDVFAECERDGSLDAAIRNAIPNDLAALQNALQKPALAARRAISAPRVRQEESLGLRRVCFNGRTAARHLRKVEAMGYEVHILPSTSPAHAGMRFEEKLLRWREALCGF